MAGDAVPHDHGATREGAHDDVLVDRLITGIELLHADYERTIAAGRSAEAAAAVDATGTTLVNERDEDAVGEEEDTFDETVGMAAQAGYTALGCGGEVVGSMDSDDDFDNFQEGTRLENFADFSIDNFACPMPPQQFPSPPSALTEEEKKVIQQTMQKLHIEPPAWAANLSDKDLQRVLNKA
eukprot:TRINITY_DN10306_c1_g1_i1.p1 TRINITY_DN10306_c1_g1~~TRINITY_DN10306_c1_g1_i1.p1  ORF type:complete len:182 (+),score=52.58 TRINITY_DN10306_c1_g1_i1:105-650(+)